MPCLPRPGQRHERVALDGEDKENLQGTHGPQETIVWDVGVWERGEANIVINDWNTLSCHECSVPLTAMEERSQSMQLCSRGTIYGPEMSP